MKVTKGLLKGTESSEKALRKSEIGSTFSQKLS